MITKTKKHKKHENTKNALSEQSERVFLCFDRRGCFRDKPISRRRDGFVVLFTVLIASIVLVIAIGISNISLGEVLLSAQAKEGNVAFFAADSGAECALYWDRVEDAYMQSITTSCIGQSADLSPVSWSPGKQGFVLMLPDNSCARVTVEKDPEAGITTRIESLGYNVACDSIADNPKAVVRAIRVTY